MLEARPAQLTASASPGLMLLCGSGQARWRKALPKAVSITPLAPTPRPNAACTNLPGITGMPSAMTICEVNLNGEDEIVQVPLQLFRHSIVRLEERL